MQRPSVPPVVDVKRLHGLLHRDEVHDGDYLSLFMPKRLKMPSNIVFLSLLTNEIHSLEECYGTHEQYVSAVYSQHHCATWAVTSTSEHTPHYETLVNLIEVLHHVS